MPHQVSGLRSQVSSGAHRYFLTKAVGWREGTALVAVAWLVPVLVHLIPWAGPRPLGVYVLPVFWTTFVALYFYGALPGLATGLVTPLANVALTGLPALASVTMMSLEIALFVAIAALLVTRRAGFWFAAPLAWVVAKAIAIAVQFFVPAFYSAESPVHHLARSMENGIAGLGMLAVIHWMLVVYYPRGEGGAGA